MNKIIEKETAEHYLWDGNCDSWILADTVELAVEQENFAGFDKREMAISYESSIFFL